MSRLLDALYLNAVVQPYLLPQHARALHAVDPVHADCSISSAIEATAAQFCHFAGDYGHLVVEFGSEAWRVGLSDSEQPCLLKNVVGVF